MFLSYVVPPAGTVEATSDDQVKAAAGESPEAPYIGADTDAAWYDEWAGDEDEQDNHRVYTPVNGSHSLSAFGNQNSATYDPSCCAETDDAEDDESGEDEDKKEDKPATRKETVTDWELLNDNKAIWLRQPSDVTDEEYQKFYKAVSKVRCRYLS